jgi:hypothetical protein
MKSSFDIHIIVFIYSYIYLCIVGIFYILSANGQYLGERVNFTGWHWSRIATTIYSVYVRECTPAYYFFLFAAGKNRLFYLHNNKLLLGQGAIRHFCPSSSYSRERPIVSPNHAHFTFRYILCVYARIHGQWRLASDWHK